MIFGTYFEKYSDAHQGVKTVSSLKLESWKHRQFWRYLQSQAFKGDELQVKREHVQDYLAHLNRQSLSENTCWSYLACIRPFYEYAVKENWIYYSPFLGVRLPKRKVEVSKVLNVSQMKELLEAPDLSTVTGLRDKIMMELMYSCGLRRSEVCALKTDDLAEDYRSLKVMGKGNKEAVLPVGKIAAHYLKHYLEQVHFSFNRLKSPHVFLSTFKRTPLSDGQVQRMVKSYADKLGLSGISPHVFRYSIATHLDEEGVDIRYIQEFLRHECISTTSRYIKQGFHRLQQVHKRTHPSSL
jgi:integrase/recombinase XerD